MNHWSCCQQMVYFDTRVKLFIGCCDKAGLRHNILILFAVTFLLGLRVYLMERSEFIYHA